VRVLVFLAVFSLLFVSVLQAFEVKGDIEPQEKSLIKEYYEKYGQQKTERLIEYLGYDIYLFDDDSVTVRSVPQITKVDFRGNLVFLDSTLLTAAAIAKGDTIFEDTLKNAARKLEAFYISAGYREATVDFQVNGENVLFEIKEGKLFLVTDIYVSDKEYGNDYHFINPIIFNDNAINRYVNDVETFFRKRGYYNVKTKVNYKENNKNSLFLNIDNPFLSVLSFLPFFHKSVTVEIDVEKGEQFGLVVKGDLSQDVVKDIEEKTGEFLKGVNSFDIRSTEDMLEDYLGSKGFIRPSVEINYDENIEILVDFQKEVKEVNLNISYENLADNAFAEEYKISKKLLSNQQSATIKNIITNYLHEEGYLDAVVSDIKFQITNGDMNVAVTVKEGKRYRVNDVYASGEKVFSDVNTGINRNEVNRLRKLVDERSKKQVFYNFLSFKEYKLNEDNTADIAFDVDLKHLTLNRIICSDAKLRDSLEQLFIDDPFITKEKMDMIENYLARRKNYINYSVELIEHEKNRADVVISGFQNQKNEIFGGFSYDSVDLFNVFAGYRRYDIFGSGHQLRLFTNMSSREQGVNLSLSGYMSLKNRIEEVYAVNWRKRDESDFEYEQYRAGVLYLKRISNVLFSAGVYGENLSLNNLDYEENIKDEIEDDFSLVGIPLSMNMQTPETDEKNFLDYSGKLSFTPVLEIGGDNFFTAEWANVVKKYIANKLRLRLEFDAGYNSGDFEDVPLTYLYTLGGPKMMKAFDYRDIGTEDSKGNVYGGDRFYYTLFGIDYELFDNVFLGPFAEYGDAMHTWTFNDGYKDVGVALTADTPFGSLGLSFAVDIGGSKKSDYAFYLTLESSF